MRRILLTLLPGCIFITCLQAQDYAVSNIPAKLLEKADAVKRMELLDYEITDANKGRLHYKVAYTILNEAGDRWGGYSEWYDKLRSIESFDGTLYDANGKKIKSLKKSDIRDESEGSDELANDNRYKWHSFFYKLYPYTVEYEVDVKYKGTMFLPRWLPQERYDMSVQESAVTVSCGAGNSIHYKMFNYDGEPAITTDSKGGHTYTWKVAALPAGRSEVDAPAWRELTTNVYMASENFILQDYKGSNSSWTDFGKFVWDLKKDRDALPPAIKQKVHAIADGLPTTKEKVEALYRFMQENTRYISIQLGIGGWQPFDATFVGEKKYGDCKALSNFMYALLKEAGIRSVYTLVNFGDDNDYLVKDLPSSQFNHVILFVPNGKDTTWLECTSQTISPGYLSGNTSDRYALAIDENGGTLVRTPYYSGSDNLQDRKINAKLDEEGNLEAMVTTKYQAVQQDRLHAMVNGLSRDKLMDMLREELDLPSYDVRTFNYKSETKGIPSINESLDLVVNNYATVTGKRLFIVPNVMNRTQRRLTADPDRRYPVELDFEYHDIDSVRIEIPEGYEIESLPADFSLSGKFGSYKSHCEIKDKAILYFRDIRQQRGHFPAKDFSELVSYYDAIYKADRQKMVLVKK